MILVVIAVQAISPDRLEVGESIHKFPNNLEISCILRIINRIRLRHTEHTTLYDIFYFSKTDSFQFMLCELDQICIRHTPQFIAFVAEILKTKAGLGKIR